jgi:Cu/Zn superoxide dismutase
MMQHMLPSPNEVKKGSVVLHSGQDEKQNEPLVSLARG